MLHFHAEFEVVAFCGLQLLLEEVSDLFEVRDLSVQLLLEDEVLIGVVSVGGETSLLVFYLDEESCYFTRLYVDLLLVPLLREIECVLGVRVLTCEH